GFSQYSLFRMESYWFLTCYSEVSLSFTFYGKPFQPWVWIVLIMSLTLVGGITFLILKKSEGMQTSSFPLWMFLLSTMFENEITIPTSISTRSRFRLILGPWSLLAVIFTASYTGIMIDEFNSPMKSK